MLHYRRRIAEDEGGVVSGYERGGPATRLAELGHELRRPEADYLRDGIHELRARHDGINYRMLYFFHGREAVVVSHGIVKQRADIPAQEIDLASKRKEEFTRDPVAHSHEDQ